MEKTMPDFGELIAHKGIHNDEFPENSLPAFKLAAEKGLAIELDVQLTKDGKIVTFHDYNLMRMCGVDAELSDFTYEQLQAFQLENTPYKIPLLAKVLKEINGKVPLLIELKNKKSCFTLWTLEKRLAILLDKYKGEFAVQSFDPFSMLWFRLFRPDIVRGQLISSYKDKKKGADAEYLARKICCQPFVWKLISKPDFVAADLRSISLEQLFASLDSGADFITWTAKGNELIETAKQFSKTVIADL